MITLNRKRAIKCHKWLILITKDIKKVGVILSCTNISNMGGIILQVDDAYHLKLHHVFCSPTFSKKQDQSNKNGQLSALIAHLLYSLYENSKYFYYLQA